MRRLLRLSVLASLSLSTLGALAQEQARPDPRARPEQRTTAETAIAPLPRESVTQQSVAFPDRTLTFKAVAGTVRLFNAETRAPQADLATIAYLRDGDPRERPVTFVFNGGPGYASGWLNIGGLGPWRLANQGDAARPSASPALMPNAETWLDFTDLVFIDPPGTGYGRVYGNEEVRRSFFSVSGDVGALAVAIRRWSEANNRMLSPKFILGESYGGFRAPKIAHALQTDQGVGVNGLFLISPVLDFGQFNQRGSVLNIAAELPSMAAVNRESKGPVTRAGMQDVEAYAAGDYLRDLMRGVNDSAAVARMAGRVAEFTGLDPALVKSLGARVPSTVFARERYRDRGQIGSAYDGTITGFDPTPFRSASEAEDQLRLGLHAPMVQAMVDLYRNRLRWSVEDGRYQFLNEQAGRQWDYGRRPAEAVSDLREALALDPGLHVLVMQGLTDLVTPYFATKMVLDQIPDFGDPDRLKLAVYSGGHMIYFRDDARKAMRADAQKLIEIR